MNLKFSSGFQVVIHRFTQAQARWLSCQSWYMQTNASVFFEGNAFLWRREFYGGLKRSLITGEMEEQVQLCRGDRRCDHMAILMVWPCALVPKRVTWISKWKVLWDGLDLDRSLDCSDKAPDLGSSMIFQKLPEVHPMIPSTKKNEVRILWSDSLPIS